MTATERAAMGEPGDAGARQLRRGLSLAGLGIAVLFFGGMIAGFLLKHADKGGGMGLRPILILAAMVIALLACLWLLVRTLRMPTGEDPLTPKERLNRNILILCGAAGGVMGLAMAMVEPRDVGDGIRVFADTPLPPGFALTIVLLIGLLLPAVSIYWHRHATDEVEADAYKTGALYALNVYMIGAPVWWFLWRGGLAPAPDGIAIYFITVATVGVIWLYGKYR
jgi:hypothetical protein